MKQVIASGILMSLLTTSAMAQLQPFTGFTRQDLKDDFTYAVDLLKRQHPNPYKFSDTVTFNRKMDSLLARLDKDPSLLSALRYSPVQLFNDVHLKLDYDEERVIDVFYGIHHFPLATATFKDKIIVNAKGTSIPFGAEILSINKMPAAKILSEIGYATYSDGFIRTGTDRTGNNLSLFISLVFPESTSYEVVYKEYGAKNPATIQLKAVDAKTGYHNRNLGELPFNTFLKRGYVTKEYLDSESTAILTVLTFMLQESDMYKELSNFFEEVKQRNIKNVIIDIRSNGGGNPNMSALLYSFVALKPFDNVFNYRTKNIDVHDPENLLNGYGTKMGEEEVKQNVNFLKQRFDYDSTAGFYYGNARLTEGSISNYPPDKNNFKGDVYVLISGGTVSAATYFAALVKNNQRGVLVGTETGSGEASTTAAWFSTYTLPKTKSRLTVPMSEIYFMKAKDDNGRGCLPHKELTFEAFQQYIRANKDPEIQYTLDLIRSAKR
ncbi:S41 family peptidase [Chitinophaga pollutisoli]|uniref:S41 family peptidase n=1 Tax=Chitinophaga pollutisoli TaxID=3133966 RepID=A0ABZ2YN06_9BACT